MGDIFELNTGFFFEVAPAEAAPGKNRTCRTRLKYSVSSLPTTQLVIDPRYAPHGPLAVEHLGVSAKGHSECSHVVESDRTDVPLRG